MERITSEQFYDAYRILDSSFIPAELKTYPRLFEEFLFKGVEIFAEYNQDKMVGVLTCWEFNDFVFVENFAVDKDRRGQGIGKSMMEDVINHYCKAIILEVEKPENDTQKRRIAFYESLGFDLTDYSYIQPPLRDEPSDVTLYIMYRGDANNLSNNNFSDIKAEIFKRIYGIDA